MPRYIRLKQEGGIYFFTVVTYKRQALFSSEEAREALRWAWRETARNYPFQLIAVCLLPDHLHTLWRLPKNDRDYSARWRFLKARFPWKYGRMKFDAPLPSASRIHKNELGFWQRRFWEHTIQDERDFERHFDYIHYNPVKHGYVKRPEEWPYSTWRRYAQAGVYGASWEQMPPRDIDSVE